MKKNEFGSYLDKNRGATTIQQLADIYGCTRVYMWDIIHGNVNPPQNYEILKNFAKKLKLNQKQTYELYDKATLEKDIPPDIKAAIIKDNIWVEKIRKSEVEKNG